MSVYNVATQRRQWPLTTADRSNKGACTAID